MTDSENTKEYEVDGNHLMERVKELVRKGNVRHIVIKNEKGKTLLEFPLNVGILGVALIPAYAAVGAIAALVAKCTIVVTNTEEKAG